MFWFHPDSATRSEYSTGDTSNIHEKKYGCKKTIKHYVRVAYSSKLKRDNMVHILLS